MATYFGTKATPQQKQVVIDGISSDLTLDLGNEGQVRSLNLLIKLKLKIIRDTIP